MPFLIRPATQIDSAHAVHVVKTVFDEYGFTWDDVDYAADLHNIQAHYLDRGHAFWVAELTEYRDGFAEGQIVGTCAVDLFDRLPGEVGTTIPWDDHIRAAGTDCSLERLYVLPGIRSLGLGSALLDMAIAHARVNERTAMEIWSDKKLTLAHRLYERYGAKRVGERICHDPDQSPEWGMALLLAG